MTMRVPVDETMDEVLRLGETTPEQVEAAAAAVAELVRRLNHATYTSQALPWPSSVAAIASRVNAAVWGLEQLLGQLAVRLRELASDGRLYHDQDRADTALAGETAIAAAELLDQAAAVRWVLTSPLDQALHLLSHLGLHTND